MPEPPALLAKTIGKMGLKGVPGLRIASSQEAAKRGGGRGRGGGAAAGGRSTDGNHTHSVNVQGANRQTFGQGRGNGGRSERGGRGRGDKRPRSHSGAAISEVGLKRH